MGTGVGGTIDPSCKPDPLPPRPPSTWPPVFDRRPGNRPRFARFFCPADRRNDEDPRRQGAANIPREGERDARGSTRPAARAGTRRAAARRRLRAGGPRPPIHGRLESEDGGADEPGRRLKIAAVRARRLAVSEGADGPSGAAYGNPLRGTRDDAPVVPITAVVIVRTDVSHAHGWRVYPVAPDGGAIYDGWIDHDPANAELALAELHPAAATGAPRPTPTSPPS